MAFQSIFALRSSSPSSSRVVVSLPNGSNYPTFRTSTTQDVFRSVVKSRKSWKSLKGGGIVWPPELEAALLEGLEAYQPDDSRETRLLGRFPLRNRFISDYIYRKTNLKRTAKQVGSRLQQLRDTCNDKKLMKLLSPFCPTVPTRYNNMYQPKSNWDDTSELGEALCPPSDLIDGPTNFCDVGSTPSPPPTTIISINITPPNISSTYEASSQPLDWSIYNGVLHPSSWPRPFNAIDPTVTLVALSPLSAYSLFTVCVAGVVVHSETTFLTEVGSLSGHADGSLLYSTTLVPMYWSKIAESSDPAQYTITQDVVQDSPDSQSTIFSAIYKFSYLFQAQISFSSTNTLPIMNLTHDANVSPSTDCHAAMDANANQVNRSAYCDAPFVQKHNPDWASPSPSQLSTETSVYQPSDDGVDSLLSPVPTCFLTNASYFPSYLGA